MKDIEKKMVDILEKFEKLTEQYAPEVSEAALQAVRISALSELVYAILGIISVFIMLYVGRKITAFFVKMDKEDIEDIELSDREIGYLLSSIVTIMVCVVIAVGDIHTLFDTWTWVALFSPELALAHKITGL